MHVLVYIVSALLSLQQSLLASLYLGGCGARETHTVQSVHHISPQMQVRETLHNLLQCWVLHTVGIYMLYRVKE